MFTNLGTVSGKKVLVTKISQVEMPGEHGGIHYPSGNFLMRLTEERPCTPALQFGFLVVFQGIRDSL